MTRAAKLHFLAWFVLSGLVCALVYHLSIGTFGHLKYPYNTFLFRPSDRFKDFRNLYNLLTQPDTPNLLAPYATGWFQMLYAVPALLALFDLSTGHAVAVYLIGFTLVFVVIARIYLAGDTPLKTARNVTLIALFSYPFLFTFDRANLEGVVFILVFLFLHAFQRERPLLAALWLGLALAIKPFPIVFVVLLLLKKQFRAVVLAGTVFVMVSALACYIRFGLQPPTNSAGLAGYQTLYALGDEGLFFGHSLWGAIKVLTYLLLTHDGAVPHIAGMAQIYFWLTVVAFLLLTGWVWRRNPPLWQQVSLLVCAMNLLPFVSGDYKLLYLFLPLFFFVNAAEAPTSAPTRRLDYIYCGLFGLLLIPKAYGHFPGLLEASWGVLINPLLMFTLVGLIVLAPDSERGA